MEVYPTAKELHLFLIYEREIGEMCGNGHERREIMDEEAGKTWYVARSSLNKDSALERGRCSLGVQCLPQVHIFDHLVSSWWCCFGRLKNLQEMEAHWSSWVAGDMP